MPICNHFCSCKLFICLPFRAQIALHSRLYLSPNFFPLLRLLLNRQLNSGRGTIANSINSHKIANRCHFIYFTNTNLSNPLFDHVQFFFRSLYLFISFDEWKAIDVFFFQSKFIHWIKNIRVAHCTCMLLFNFCFRFSSSVCFFSIRIFFFCPSFPWEIID